MIDDADLYDLAVWVAWDRNLAIFWKDATIRRRKGIYTALYLALGCLIGYRAAGPVGAIIGCVVASMFACENTWGGTTDELLSLSEYLLYSDEVGPNHKKGLVAAVRNATLKFESAEFAVLSDLVGSHPQLEDQVENAIKYFLKREMCREVMSLPEGRPGTEQY